MIGDSIPPLTQKRWELENPCCNFKESGMSMTCRCDDRKKYDAQENKRKIYRCLTTALIGAGKNRR